MRVEQIEQFIELLRSLGLSLDLADITERTVASCRNNRVAISVLARQVGLSSAQIEEKMFNCSGNMKIRNFLARLEQEAPCDSTASRRVVPGQGGALHRELQNALFKLGYIRDFECRTDQPYLINRVERRPDVCWHAHGGDGPSHVFEISFGARQEFAQSWETLEKFRGKWGSDVVLIVPHSRLALAQDTRPIYLYDESQPLIAEELLHNLRSDGMYGFVRYLKEHWPQYSLLDRDRDRRRFDCAGVPRADILVRCPARSAPGLPSATARSPTPSAGSTPSSMSAGRRTSS